MEAMVYATEALLADPDYKSAKSFLQSNAEDAVSWATDFLVATEETANPQELEKRYDLYREMDEFYANMRKSGMPIQADKRLFGLIKGWEWSIPVHCPKLRSNFGQQ